jgi:hypothetical protein
MAMSKTKRDIERLMRPAQGPSLLDGLLLGAVIGAAGAALVLVTQAVVARRVSRRYTGAGDSGALPGRTASPL